MCNPMVVECRNSGLRYIPTEIAPTVTAIYLTGNNISTIPSDAFKSLTSLTHLNIVYNQISTIPSEAFKPLTSLKTPYLYIKKIFYSVRHNKSTL